MIYSTMLFRVVLNDSLYNWVNKVQISNLSYFKVRKDLMTELSRMSVLKSDENLAEGELVLSQSTFNSIWQFLTTRNDKITDDSRLAFQAAIDDLLTNLSQPVEEPAAPQPVAAVGD